MPSKKTRYRVAVDRVITDDRGRQFGPGDEISDLVLRGSDHNEQLVASGQLVEINEAKRAPAKAKSEGESKK
jgi:hypothetical protein